MLRTRTGMTVRVAQALHLSPRTVSCALMGLIHAPVYPRGISPLTAAVVVIQAFEMGYDLRGLLPENCQAKLRARLMLAAEMPLRHSEFRSIATAYEMLARAADVKETA